MINVTPVILCDGSGTSRWPLSRACFPKQFLSLAGNESLLQQAAQPLVGLGADEIQVAKPLIVTGEEHRFLASEQLREAVIELGAASLEPVDRNTAPALTQAALAAQADVEDPVLVVTPADQAGLKKLLFLGSSCIYPKLAQQPMREDALLAGTLEPTNEPYAIAKIAGIKLCESYNRQYGESHGLDYRSVMPTNICGPGDNCPPENSHVIPLLIRRFHEAKVKNVPSVAIWGTGTPKREFL